MSLKPSCLDTQKGYFIGSTQCVPPGTTSWTSLGGLSSTGSHTQADSVGVGVGVGVALFVVLTAVIQKWASLEQLIPKKMNRDPLLSENIKTIQECTFKIIR